MFFLTFSGIFGIFKGKKKNQAAEYLAKSNAMVTDLIVYFAGSDSILVATPTESILLASVLRRESSSISASFVGPKGTATTQEFVSYVNLISGSYTTTHVSSSTHYLLPTGSTFMVQYTGTPEPKFLLADNVVPSSEPSLKTASRPAVPPSSTIKNTIWEVNSSSTESRDSNLKTFALLMGILGAMSVVALIVVSLWLKHKGAWGRLMSWIRKKRDEKKGIIEKDTEAGTDNTGSCVNATDQAIMHCNEKIGSDYYKGNSLDSSELDYQQQQEYVAFSLPANLAQPASNPFPPSSRYFNDSGSHSAAEMTYVGTNPGAADTDLTSESETQESMTTPNNGELFAEPSRFARDHRVDPMVRYAARHSIGAIYSTNNTVSNYINSIRRHSLNVFDPRFVVDPNFSGPNSSTNSVAGTIGTNTNHTMTSTPSSDTDSVLHGTGTTTTNEHPSISWRTVPSEFSSSIHSLSGESSAGGIIEASTEASTTQSSSSMVAETSSSNQTSTFSGF